MKMRKRVEISLHKHGDVVVVVVFLWSNSTGKIVVCDWSERAIVQQQQQQQFISIENFVAMEKSFTIFLLSRPPTTTTSFSSPTLPSRYCGRPLSLSLIQRRFEHISAAKRKFPVNFPNLLRKTLHFRHTKDNTEINRTVFASTRNTTRHRQENRSVPLFYLVFFLLAPPPPLLLLLLLFAFLLISIRIPCFVSFVSLPVPRFCFCCWFQFQFFFSSEMNKSANQHSHSHHTDKCDRF